MRARGLKAAAWLALLLPAFLSFNYVYRFGVDVPFGDDWELVPLIDRWFQGSITFDDLFAQHNEHRIFWPRLAMLAVVSARHYDAHALMSVSWLMLAAMVGVLFWEHVSTFGRSALALLVWAPLAWAFFSPRQHENLLWGWQIQFFMCSAGFGVTMYFLHTARSWWRFALGVGFALITSYTIAAGLGVWPSGALYLFATYWLHRKTDARRRLTLLGAWLVASAASTAFYLRGYHSIAGHPDPLYFAGHPLAGMRYVLVALGSPYSHEAGGALAAGALLVGLAALGVVAWQRGDLDRERAVLALPFAVFALGFVAMIAVGRGAWGDQSALASRYTTITVFFGFAVHRVCLAISWQRLKPALAGVLLSVFALVLVAFFDRSYRAGFDNKAKALQNAELLRDYRNRSDEELQDLYPSAAVVRERAPILERYGLSSFHAR